MWKQSLRNSRTKSMYFLTLIAFLTLSSLLVDAQEARYLPLQRPGQASVIIDHPKQIAYIVDLGKYGDGDKVTLDGLPLLDRLDQLDVRKLVFACSHPHADHMGGIKALFKKPRGFFSLGDPAKPRFDAITVIDDSVSNTLFSTLKQSLRDGPAPALRHISAREVNAFAGISDPTDQIFIENIPYVATTNAGAHGRSLVTRMVLGRKHINLDLDDADSAVIRKVVDTLLERGDELIDSFVVPHHGSVYHDIEPILRLKPKTAIITVNPANPYGHPAPSILLELMDKLGPENVLFTGSVDSIRIDPDGIQHAIYTAASRDSYALFVEPNYERALARNNPEEIELYKQIQKRMFESPRTEAPAAADMVDPPAKPPSGMLSSALEEKIARTGSMHSPEFELGMVPHDGASVSDVRRHKIFRFDSSNSAEERNYVPVRADPRLSSGGGRSPDRLPPSEAQRAVDSLPLLGNDPAPAVVEIARESSAGIRDGVDPTFDFSTSQLSNAASPPTATGAPRHSAQTPKGGMVYLTGGKLFASSTELSQGILDLCGHKLCMRTSEQRSAKSYALPFEVNELFREVWKRVVGQNIDAFYLSINPTKRFLRNADFKDIPTNQLRFGDDLPQELRANEVVTVGNITNSEIGKIMWEADVEFKAKALGFNVLTGRHPQDQVSPSSILAKQRFATEDDLHTDSQDRWCRLYWTDGPQTIQLDQLSGELRLSGTPVIARAEPMKLEDGRLHDAPKASWCGDMKQVAAALQREANIRVPRRPVLAHLRLLAETQNFVRWVRDHGISTSEALQDAMAHDTSSTFHVPRWTSGIRSDPPILFQQEEGYINGRSTIYLHYSRAGNPTVEACMDDAWARADQDWPKLGCTRNPDNGRWTCRKELISKWTSAQAQQAAKCAKGKVLSTTFHPDELDRSNRQLSVAFLPHLSAIEMHGGVLLGAQRGLLEYLAKNEGKLVSPGGHSLIQRVGNDLHFWKFEDPSSHFGSLAQHVIITDSFIQTVYATEGKLRVVVETKPDSLIKNELRAARSRTFPTGLEWANARHAGDGALVFEKVAWPCKASNGDTKGCIGIADLSFKNLGPRMSTRDEPAPLITVEQLLGNLWGVEIDTNSFASELDQKWDSVSDSAINSRLAVAHLYTSWGFLEKARLKYDELIPNIEEETQDEVLYNALGRRHLALELEDLIVQELLSAQRDLQGQVEQRLVEGPAALSQLSALENIDLDLSPRAAAQVWDGLSTTCDSLLEVLGTSAAYRKKIAELRTKYATNAVRNAFFAEGIANPWRPEPDHLEGSRAAVNQVRQ